jgi:hypothetical protein
MTKLDRDSIFKNASEKIGLAGAVIVLAMAACYVVWVYCYYAGYVTLPAYAR